MTNMYLGYNLSSMQIIQNIKKQNIKILSTTVGCVDYWWQVSLSIMFQLLVYHGVLFYWWGKPEKTADLPQATHKFYHIMLNQVHLTKGRIRTGRFTEQCQAFIGQVHVNGTGCVGRCKSKYHTIAATVAAAYCIVQRFI